ncbi:MAG: NAD(P)/FAD-dependent oxidoreductase [Deltaproteobacteria bacterium]|nr:NAD(P)/FAD-dependent oxidoreductase [Deltaproteobacteria bacterium]
MQFSTDDLVVGAGVVGLAVAARLASEGRRVLLVERQPGPARETSTRNSGVLHAGFYYPTGSLKARLCVRGRELLAAHCDAAGVPWREVGKLVVAREASEEVELRRLLEQGERNGVASLELLDGRQVARREPALRVHGALWSPRTGIVDAHALAKSLEAAVRQRGAEVLYRCTVTSASRLARGYEVQLAHPAGTELLRCERVVNAAGLDADRVAASAGLSCDPVHHGRGDYFRLRAGRPLPVAHLVYPVPARALASLGVHLTLTLDGGLRLGPDLTYVPRDAPHPDVDPAKARAFAEAVAPLLPGLSAADLEPDSFGLRPKLQGPGEPWRDFLVQEERARGFPGWVNLLGIESPGLTASLALAEEVASLLAQ